MNRNCFFLLVLLTLSSSSIECAGQEATPVSIREARQILLERSFGNTVLVEGDVTSVTFLTSSFRRKNLPVLFIYTLVDDTGKIEILANPGIPPLKGGHIRARIGPTTTLDSDGKEPGLPAFEIERLADVANQK